MHEAISMWQGWIRRSTAMLVALAAAQAMAQQPARQLDAVPGVYRAAVVVLVDEPEFRASLEDSLVAKGGRHGFDLVASHALVPDRAAFTQGVVPPALREHGVNVVVMLRPAAVGAGASLESVRDSLPSGLYKQIRRNLDRASER